MSRGSQNWNAAQALTTAKVVSMADPALCFGSVIDAYHRARPGYPLEAVHWLTGDGPLSVLELGSGTGKLTEQLVALGHDVHATDPDPVMLDKLAQTVHVSRISQTSAEEIPAADASYDVVVAGQAFHWFDRDQAMPEIARVLKDGGHLALVWNTRDERVPRVKQLNSLLLSERHHHDELDPADVVESSPCFGPVEYRSFEHRHRIDRALIQDLVLSRSYVATLSEDARQARIRDVLGWYDAHCGGNGMRLPYVAECYRAAVSVAGS